VDFKEGVDGPCPDATPFNTQISQNLHLKLIFILFSLMHFSLLSGFTNNFYQQLIPHTCYMSCLSHR